MIKTIVLTVFSLTAVIFLILKNTSDRVVTAHRVEEVDEIYEERDFNLIIGIIFALIICYFLSKMVFEWI